METIEAYQSLIEQLGNKWRFDYYDPMDDRDLEVLITLDEFAELDWLSVDISFED